MKVWFIMVVVILYFVVCFLEFFWFFIVEVIVWSFEVMEVFLDFCFNFWFGNFIVGFNNLLLRFGVVLILIDSNLVLFFFELVILFVSFFGFLVMLYMEILLLCVDLCLSFLRKLKGLYDLFLGCLVFFVSLVLMYSRGVRWLKRNCCSLGDNFFLYK